MYRDAEFHKKHFCLSGTKALMPMDPSQSKISGQPGTLSCIPIQGCARTFLPGFLI